MAHLRFRNLVDTQDPHNAHNAYTRNILPTTCIHKRPSRLDKSKELVTDHTLSILPELYQEVKYCQNTSSNTWINQQKKNQHFKENF